MAESKADTTFTFADPDGFEIFVRRWAPEAGLRPKAVVQIAHGAAEHSLRYERFARFLNGAGYLVYANDHRGHWRTAGSDERAGSAGNDGWNGIVGDAKRLTNIITQENPGLPVFLMGHSLGSLVAQQYAESWGEEIRGVVLSGTFGTQPGLDALIAAAESSPRNEPSTLFALMFSSFNQAFNPGKPGFDWLSRDEAEVQKYVDDPWCGFTFDGGLVADFLKGMREIWRPENEARIPKSLPVFVVSGDQDPVGGNTESVSALVERYRALGLADLSYKFYPGARHELLNETNRDEVQRDLRDWFDRHLP